MPVPNGSRESGMPYSHAPGTLARAPGARERTMIEAVTPDSPMYDQVVELGDANSATLGILPYAAIKEAAADGRVLAYVAGGAVKGYALFSRRVRTSDISLTHLCVGQQFRSRGIARALVEAIVERHPHRAGIRLLCRKDYDAHEMWSQLGFCQIGERPGRSRAGHLLVAWWRTIAAPSLFDPPPDNEDTRIVVALDIGVFRDILDNCDSTDTLALTADWVDELAALAITDDVVAATDMPEGDEPATDMLEGYRILQSESDQQRRVLHRLQAEPIEYHGERHALRIVAQAAAAGASNLVTDDEGLLRHSEAVERLTGVTMSRPVDLLLQLQSHGGEHDYRTRVIAASGLSVLPLSRVPADADLEPFCRPHPDSHLSDLTSRIAAVAGHQFGRMDQLVSADGSCTALAAYYREDNNVTVTVLRSAAAQDEYSCIRQLVHHLRDAVARAGPARITLVDDADSAIASALRDEGFVVDGASWAADVRTVIYGSGDPLPDELYADGVRDLTPELVSKYEKHLWPAKVFAGIVPSYVVPIQPKYARVLLGYEERQGRLFEEHETAAAARENVYYRSPRHFASPARVLWWVSGGGSTGGMRALSWLDAVHTGDPHQLHRRYRNRGVLREQQVVDRAHASGRSGILVATALLFSRTEVFAEPIPLDRAQGLYEGMRTPGYFQTMKQIEEASVLEFYMEGMKCYDWSYGNKANS